MPLITFTDADFKDINPLQDMVITVEIKQFAVMKTLVHQRSLVDILYWKIFKKLQIVEADIQPHDEYIIGFFEERVYTNGYIDFSIKYKEG